MVAAPAHRLTVGTASVIAADLTTKLAAAALADGSRSGPVVPVRNPTFSLGTASAPFLAMIILAALGIAIAARYTVPPALHGPLPLWVPSCLLGGAFANLIDRMWVVLISIVAATTWAAEPRIWLAVATAALAMIASRSAVGAMLAGTAVAALGRYLEF